MDPGARCVPRYSTPGSGPLFHGNGRGGRLLPLRVAVAQLLDVRTDSSSCAGSAIGSTNEDGPEEEEEADEEWDPPLASAAFGLALAADRIGFSFVFTFASSRLAIPQRRFLSQMSVVVGIPLFQVSRCPRNASPFPNA